jgi:alpha-L-fucosidase 2
MCHGLRKPQDASFERLRGRGAFIVSSSITNGTVGKTTIVSERGATCVMRRPASWPKPSVHVLAVATGKAVGLDWKAEDSFFSFGTAAGGVYELSGR